MQALTPSYKAYTRTGTIDYARTCILLLSNHTSSTTEGILGLTPPTGRQHDQHVPLTTLALRTQALTLLTKRMNYIRRTDTSSKYWMTYASSPRAQQDPICVADASISPHTRRIYVRGPNESTKVEASANGHNNYVPVGYDSMTQQYLSDAADDGVCDHTGRPYSCTQQRHTQEAAPPQLWCAYPSNIRALFPCAIATIQTRTY